MRTDNPPRGRLTEGYVRVAVTVAASLGALLSGRLQLAATAAPVRRPGVVLITLDTTRADRLGCYGRPGAGTPNLDRLAAAGARFAEAWSPAPITLPSHLSMMTGCTPITHGVRDNGVTKYDGRIKTLAMRFAAAGYRTAAVVSSSVLDSTWGANAGFAMYDERFDRAGERSGAAATTRAIELLATSPDPLFLWVHYYDPHWPYDPPSPFAERYRDDPYQGEIASVDAEVGRLLAALEQAGRRPFVVVAADHGEGLGEHRERTHGIFTYRSTLRVPFLIAGPGIAAGRVVRDPVSLVDLAPTVAELAGLTPAAIEDGISQAAVVTRGAPAPAHRQIYFESMLPFDSFGWAFPRGTTDGRYVFIDLPKREVYDLAGDPGQTKNLYAEGDALSQELAGRFDALTSKLAERAGQGLPVPISDEERAKLASLGYVSGSPSAVAHPTLDPKDVVEIADLLDRGRELRKNGQPGEALTIAEEILRKNPENVSALSLRGQALLSQKRFRDAAAAFGAAVARNPKLAANRFDLGSSLAGAGDTTQAEAEWRRAIELEPHFAEPRASLIAAARERGDVAGALTLAKEAAASGAESAELNFEIGLAYAIAEDRAAAKRWFESAVRLRPDYVAALSNLGRIAYDDRRFDEALARFRAASAAAPGEAMFHEQIAVILLDDKHDRAGALDAYREALAVEHDPQEQARLEQAIAELAHE